MSTFVWPDFYQTTLKLFTECNKINIINKEFWYSNIEWITSLQTRYLHTGLGEMKRSTSEWKKTHIFGMSKYLGQGNIWKCSCTFLSVKYFYAFLKPKNINYTKKHFCKIFDRVAGGYQFWYNYHPSHRYPSSPHLSCLVHFESFTVSVYLEVPSAGQIVFKVPHRKNNYHSL